MTAGAAPQLLPSLLVDPIDYLLADIAAGRHRPGDSVHVHQLTGEHGLTPAEAHDVLEAACCLGVVSRAAHHAGAVVCWSPDVSQRQLQRLARAMVAAIRSSSARDPYGVDVIDAEESLAGDIGSFGLTASCDVVVFLAVAHALLGRRSIALLDELAAPVAVFFSETAQRVHGIELAADAETRRQIVGELVRSLIDRRPDDFAALMRDYVTAMSID